MAILSDEFDVTKEKVEHVHEEAQIPGGYRPIELSMNGTVYAPKKFHIRNFTTEDLLGIVISDDENLPVKVCEMLQKVIWEKDVHVRDFAEAEVTETLLRLLRMFYQSTITGIEYTPTEEDMKFLQQQNGGPDSAEYRRIEADLKNKRWVPKFDVDLKTVEYYDPKDFKKTAAVTKKDGFTCKYSLPRYGDVLDIRQLAFKFFKEKDKEFARVENMIKFKQDAEERWRNGEPINLQSIPEPTPEEMEAYNEYQIQKSAFWLIATRAIHLEEYKGQYVGNLPLDQKFQMAKDPELDYGTFKMVSEAFAKQPIGVKKEINIINPITNMPSKYEYTFRLFTILQAIVSNDVDGTTITLE